MLGMSSTEWSRYMAETVGVPLSADEVNAAIVERLRRGYEQQLPVLPGARDAVRRLAARWPLALASSSNRELIDLVLEVMGVASLFAATVSSEEVERGKPAPDVYLEAARRLGVAPGACVAVEDAGNGIRSALAAGMAVIAIPNPHYPPDDDVLGRVGRAIDGLDALTVEVVAAAGQPSTAA